jgi:hypothetical protein
MLPVVPHRPRSWVVVLLLVALPALLVLDAAAPAAGDTSSASCSLQLPSSIAAPPNLAARGTLVPLGARTLLLCEYGGLGAGPNSGRLAAADLVTARSSIVAVTRSFDALKNASHTTFHCPMDDGSAITATFEYPEAKADVVRLELTGCQTVSNGKLLKSAASAAGKLLVGRLRHLLQPAGRAGTCAADQVSTAAETQGENTTTWIGVTLQNQGAACRLRRIAVSIEIELAGRAAEVRGNPLTLHASARLYHGGTDLLVADWGNWCGSRRGISLVVRLAGRTLRRAVTPLPVCLSKHASRLVAGPP